MLLRMHALFNAAVLYFVTVLIAIYFSFFLFEYFTCYPEMCHTYNFKLNIRRAVPVLCYC